MINWLPFEQYSVNTSLSKNQVEETLKTNLAWSNNLGISFTKNTSKEFEGFVENGTFKVRRILKSGFNSYIPIVSGNIKPAPNNESVVKIKLRLHPLIATILIGLILFAISLLLLPFFTQATDSNTFTELIKDDAIRQNIEQEMAKMKSPVAFNWNLLIVLLATYLMVLYFYNAEAKRVKDQLNIWLRVE